MTKLLLHFFYNFQVIAVLTSFLISLYAIIKYDIPIYLKVFVIYTTVAILLLSFDFISSYFMRSELFLAQEITRFSILFHFIFLSIFVIKFNHFDQKKYFYLITIIVSFLIFYAISSKFTSRESLLPYSFSAFGLILLSLLFFYSLISKFKSIDLIKYPPFWIIIGVFLSSGIQLPFASTYKLFYKNVSETSYRLFNCAIIFSYLLLHLFIIKAYLCSMKNLKIY